MPQYLAGYAGRTVLGIGFALVFAGLGVILGRMGLLLFGVTSWFGWVAMLVGGIGLGAGLGSAAAWLWLKGTGPVFSLSLGVIAAAAGISGGWFAFVYGTGVKPECCASPEMGPISYAVLGAVIFSNAVTLLGGVAGQVAIRFLRRRQGTLSSPPALRRNVEDTASGRPN